MTPVSVLSHYVRNHVQTVTLNNNHVESMAGLLWEVLLYLTSAGPQSSGAWLDWNIQVSSLMWWVPLGRQLEDGCSWDSWVLSVSSVRSLSLSLWPLPVASPGGLSVWSLQQSSHTANMAAQDSPKHRSGSCQVLPRLSPMISIRSFLPNSIVKVRPSPSQVQWMYTRRYGPLDTIWEAITTPLSLSTVRISTTP